jgi:hypothetical protein
VGRPQPVLHLSADGELRLKRIELILLAFFLACWAVSLAVFFHLLRIDGSAPLGFYGLYGIAASLGWLFGNIYVQRTRKMEKPARRPFWVVYFFGPLGIVYLLRCMEPLAFQRAAPLVLLYAWAVFSIFFAVPIVFRIPFAGNR